MSAYALRTFATMIVAVTLLAGMLLMIGIGPVAPIDGTLFIDKGRVCAGGGCTEAVPVTLPYFPPKTGRVDLQSLTFRATFDLPEIPTAMTALYIPKFADHLNITLNDEVLRMVDLKRRHWSEPFLLSVSPSLLREENNELTLIVYGRGIEGIELFPVSLGPYAILKPVFDTRFAFGPGLARFNLIFTMILGLIYLLIWSNRRQDARYLWLGLSCFSALPVLLHFGFGFLWANYKIWTGVVHLSIALYALFNVRFVREHLKLAPLGIEKAMMAVLGGFAVLLVFVPGEQLQLWALFVDAITGLLALAALTVFWMFRHQTPLLEFLVIFGCLLFASALGVHEMVLTHSPGPGRSFHMFHIVPVFMALVCMWVIVTQLLLSLKKYEDLAVSLNDTVAQTTRKLEHSFARIAEVERRKAVDVERNRIMLDLHDGIGGQLVSTLSYMENSGQEDPTLKEALEAALRDLALILDSLDSDDSLTTLLGMLRTRLEPLLADQGLRFDWQIMDDPIVPEAGPSTNLHLARIVQEAITNVIKHAQASTVTVYTDAESIVISDDGIGIDQARIDCEDCMGHGLEGMRQRAASMGASFAIAGTDKGTSITLRFDGA